MNDKHKGAKKTMADDELVAFLQQVRERALASLAEHVDVEARLAEINRSVAVSGGAATPAMRSNDPCGLI